MTAEVVTLADFRPVDAAADLSGDLWAALDADKAAVMALVRDRLPPGWIADFDYEWTDWAATVLHGTDPKGWPGFTMTRCGSGVVFASVWPCGSQVACVVDSLETALGMIPGGVFEAAAGRHGAMDEPSDAVN